MTRSKLTQIDPFHSAQWRWDLAARLRQEGPEPDPAEDPGVLAAIHYQSLLDAGTASVAVEMPELAAAHQLHLSGGAQRDEVQARLLAGQTVEVIGGHSGVAPAVVSGYASIFFDVVTHLDAGDWIAQHGIRMWPWGEPYPQEGTIWRYLGWHCPAAMELVIADFRNGAGHDPADNELADRIHTFVQFTGTPQNHPAFRKLLRKMLDDAVQRAAEHPSRELAQNIMHMEFLLAASSPRQFRRRRRGCRSTTDVERTVHAQRRFMTEVTQFRR